ncbi:hypothetical protein XBJ2_1450001 [Xenorhabdus bovienii str. Jollieti]|uniref:Uncharacterized protein n=1 Tax=Xenorhabdus bovienii (strain SS-2004) TaxID=406818 RepID=D3V7N4_XENBS|nr:hypothetical protein [Xenorhabdus bovienii]CBJ81846.1 hypothetical protein XBJ1_2722 [Xenorhabdus bovienii SS-2004]CDH27698.1 hypothetical protein XBJ2_1450001 [Xenorhabdus bovienii str. Jollieti]
MAITINFTPSYEVFQDRSAVNINILAYEYSESLPGLEIVFECSVGSFVVNGEDTGKKRLFGKIGGTGETSVLVVGPMTGGNGQLTVSLRENNKQIGILPYDLITTDYQLNFSVTGDYAMADGKQSNKVNAILTGMGTVFDLKNRQLDLIVTGSASFEQNKVTQTTSINTDPLGNVSFELYDANNSGETVTLAGQLSGNKISHNTEQIHFQPNLDCDAHPPSNEIYIRTIFTYSINNDQYLLRQRQCDHLVTVHKLLAGGKQGEQTSTGQKWVNYYDLMFPFVIENEQYVFGLAKDFINAPQNTDKSFWMIAKLDENGQKEIIDSGYFDVSYDVGFAYNIGGRQFILLHGKGNGWPIICYEIFTKVKMNRKPICQQNWDNFYGVVFFISMEGNQYIYCHTKTTKNIYTFEFNKDGTLGKLAYSDTWSYYYYPQFPYFIKGKYYYTGQRFYDNYWFISYIYSKGVPEHVNEHAEPWDTSYQYLIPFSIGENQYFLRQNQSKNHWYITEIIADTKMGEDRDSR